MEEIESEIGSLDATDKPNSFKTSGEYNGAGVEIEFVFSDKRLTQINCSFIPIRATGFFPSLVVPSETKLAVIESLKEKFGEADSIKSDGFISKDDTYRWNFGTSGISLQDYEIGFNTFLTLIYYKADLTD
ncbi:MAG: hypothetical protein Q4D93_01620 [Porphyromonas sp.]|nr:hypothetical protein [Porphyromonas sp.]